MTGSPDVTEELEELDIAERLAGLDSRMVALGLALRGAEIGGEAFDALSVIIGDVRSELFDLGRELREQDDAKRARGEPRVGRIVLTKPTGAGRP